ncbi:MAG: hypothetical protein Q4C70_13090 [Planctomycetia bacterium]|nr:hypothetical protein [Planctomycetia bacterium]
MDEDKLIKFTIGLVIGGVCFAILIFILIFTGVIESVEYTPEEVEKFKENPYLEYVPVEPFPH